MDQVALYREILALIEELAPYGTWEWVVGSTALLWSSGLYRILGVDPSTPATVDLYAQMIHPDDRVDFSNPSKIVAEYYATGVRQVRVLRESGEIRVLRSFARLFPAVGGRPQRMIGVAFDVTDASRGFAALHREKVILEAVRDLVDVSPWQTTADGMVTEVDPWPGRIGAMGLPPSGWGRFESVHPDDRERVSRAWRDAVSGRKTYEQTYRITSAGATRSVRSRAVPLHGATGRLEGWLGFTAGTIQNAPEPSPLTGPLVRAARGLLDWGLSDLADRSGISISSIRRVEADARTVSAEILERLRRTFLDHGVRFVTVGDETNIVSTGRAAGG